MQCQPSSQTNFLDARNSARSLRRRPSPSSLTTVPACRGGAASKTRPRSTQPPRPTSPASTPRSASDSVSDRLLLRRHDPLERRVARLVDLLDHAHHGRRRRLDHLVAVVGQPLDRHAWPSVDRDLLGEGQLRQAQPLGQHRRAPRSSARRRTPSPSSTRSNPTGRLPRSPWPGPTRSPARPSRAAPSSITWIALSAPIDSALRTVSVAASGPMHRTVTSPPCASCDLERLLDGVLVHLVHHRVGRRPVQRRVRRGQLLLRPGVRHLLHTDDDVHAAAALLP